MKFRLRPHASLRSVGSAFRTCDAVDCFQAGVIGFLRDGEQLLFCIEHANAYSRGDLEPVQE